MGIIQKLLCCDSKPKSTKIFKEEDFIKEEKLTPYKFKNKNINSIPKDEFLCPFCDLVPKILNINCDTGIITLHCKSHKLIKRPINETEKLSSYNMKYCLICKESIDENCIEYFHLEHKPNCIPISEKNNTYSIHPDERANTYCYDCKQNILIFINLYR